MNIEGLISHNLYRQLEIRGSVKSMNEEKERAEKQNIRLTYIGVSLAACLIIAFFATPWFKAEMSPISELAIVPPSLAEYRSASTSATEIDYAMANKDYEIAIQKIDSAIVISSETLRILKESATLEEESSLYEMEVETAHHYQLRWMRIYALVCLFRNDEAIDELESFIAIAGEHQKDALSLLNKLKE